MVCNQAIRSIVDKIERKEKEAMRKVKKQELEDEKHKKMLAAKLQQALFKHKEIVKKDILKKRALMEKNLQQDIQVSIFFRPYFHFYALPAIVRALFFFQLMCLSVFWSVSLYQVIERVFGSY